MVLELSSPKASFESSAFPNLNFFNLIQQWLSGLVVYISRLYFDRIFTKWVCVTNTRLSDKKWKFLLFILTLIHGTCHQVFIINFSLSLLGCRAHDAYKPRDEQWESHCGKRRKEEWGRSATSWGYGIWLWSASWKPAPGKWMREK